MTRSWPAWLLSGLLGLGVFDVSPPANADPPPPAADKAVDADAHFRQGVSLYKEQSFAAALVEFRKAYAILPDWHVLYNIGITELELKDDAGALNALGRYLHEASGISEKRKEDVEAQVERLRDRVGTLAVSVNRAGAEVTIDDVSVGKSPLPGPIVVNVGPRRVVATLPGGQEASRVVDVASRDRVAVDLAFAEESAPSAATAPLPEPPRPPPVAAPPPVPEEPPPAHRADSLWVGFVTTGALAAGGAVTGILALKARSDAEADASQLGVSASTLQDANAQKRTLAAVTDALLGSAIVAGGVTLYFALRHPGRRAASSAAFSVSLAPTAASLSVGF